MAAELFADVPVTVVSSGGTDAPASGTQETWTVASPGEFPTAATGTSQFHVGDPDATSEIIAVTNVSGSTWTVTRGADSTTPVTHASGFTVQQVVPASVLAAFAQTGFGDIGGSGTAPTVVSTHLGAALPITQGGTGQETQPGAITALTGTQGAGKYLRSDGTNASLSVILAADVPTLNQNTSGTASNITATLDLVPAPAANVSLNGHKITSLASGGTASTDAAAFGQILPISGGTMTGWLAPAVSSLSYGTAISVNAALGNVFAVTLTGSAGTLANPTNPVDGQVIRIRVIQDSSGSRTVSWGTAYDWGSASTAPTLSTAASAVDIIGFEYVASKSKWAYLSAPVPQGF